MSLMSNKPVDTITEEDLQSLIENGEIETKRWIIRRPYRISMSKKEKKEFLSDVTSFANASGGDLI